MPLPTSHMETLVATLNERFPEYRFEVVPGGRKVTRIAKAFRPLTEEDAPGGRSVFMFVDNETGAFLKAAGWARPARGPRYTPATLEEAVDILKTVADPSGGFLYRR